MDRTSLSVDKLIRELACCNDIASKLAEEGRFDLPAALGRLVRVHDTDRDAKLVTSKTDGFGQVRVIGDDYGNLTVSYTTGRRIRLDLATRSATCRGVREVVSMT